MDNLIFKIKLTFKLLVGYTKTHWKLFLSGLGLGIAAFFLLPIFFTQLMKINRSPIIGVVGNYTSSNLPNFIQEQISFGLTKLDEQGLATSGAAISYSASESAKSITFKLDPDLTWQDGQPLKSEDINYNLKGVKTIKTDSELTYILPEEYSPLPAILSQPLFKNGEYKKNPYFPDFLNSALYKTGLIGLGENRLDGIKFTGRFVSQLTLLNTKTNETKTYKFFPSLDLAVNALKLGEISQIDRLYSQVNLSDDQHYETKETILEDHEAMIFYNLDDQLMANKEFRQALNYALPDNFTQGAITESPFAKNSWARNANLKHYPQNLALATAGIKKFASPSGQTRQIIRISTNQQLQSTANEIAQAWTDAGLDVRIENTDVMPRYFQAYLAIVPLPKDPDQYFLWHSTQSTNISNYKSPKVDRLLEEARQTFDLKTRQIKYSDFQKAITEDAPAAFLFYPKIYSIVRKY